MNLNDKSVKIAGKTYIIGSFKYSKCYRLHFFIKIFTEALTSTTASNQQFPEKSVTVPGKSIQQLYFIQLQF